MEGFFSEEDILNIWDIKISNIREEETFNVYIDNPFCVQECAYCKHTGSLIKDHVQDFKKYYNTVLPKQIKSFSKILRKTIPDTVYFGGGTPSAISSSQMDEIFLSLPNFKKIPNKVFECNPNLLDEKKIELLTNNNFSYVSFGIQSLREDVLRYNNRTGYKNTPLKEYIKEFKDNNVLVNCDLMAFIAENKTSFQEIERVERDLVDLIEDYKPSMITVYPESLFLQEDIKRGVRMSKDLRKMILRISEKYNLNHYDYHLSLEDSDIKKEMEICYHLGMVTSEEMYRVKQYDSSGPPSQSGKQNCLAIGGFKHHRPYSYHGQDFIYSNLNDENKGFSYFVTKKLKGGRPKFTNMDFI